ncbi:hypothetical protein [Herpetosiphon sp. NSE202]|uniref:hypothetical protein n=1 Tax=Herpetosiphon sp. NSE202 TaxID=3351349 RepID=UPI0036321FB2
MYKISAALPVKRQLPLSTIGLWIAAHLPGLFLIAWLARLDDAAIPDIMFIPLMLIVSTILIQTGQAMVISKLTKKRLFIAWWPITIVLSVVFQRMFGASLYFLWPFATFQATLFIAIAQFIIAKYYGYTMRFWVVLNLGAYVMHKVLLHIFDYYKHLAISNYAVMIITITTMFITSIGLFFIQPNHESKSRLKGLL